MKKIAIASAAMGGAALIAFGASGTFASFTDTENRAGNAGAGTMDLTLGGSESATITGLGLNPGDTATYGYWVNNAGTTNATLLADLTILGDEDRNCSEAEREPIQGVYAGDATCDWGTNGEFSATAQVQFFENTTATEATCATQTGGTAIGPATTLKQSAAANAQALGAVGKDSGRCIVLRVSLPGNATNAVMGDVTTFTFTATLNQAPVATGSRSVAGNAGGTVSNNPTQAQLP
ncbi:TasA family protein [Blastococcus sp. SYSU D00695]